MILTSAALKAMPWGRILPALALLAAVGAGIAWHVHRVDKAREEGNAAGAAEVQAQWDKATIDAQNLAARTLAERRKIEQERAATLMKEVENAQQATAVAEAALDRARATGERLRLDAKALAASCRRPAGSDPTTAAGGPPGPDPGTLLADLSGWLEQAGREYAQEAQRRGIAGAACEAISDGLQLP